MFEPPKGRHRVEPNTAKHLTLDTEMDSSTKPPEQQSQQVQMQTMPTQGASISMQVDQQGLPTVRIPFSLINIVIATSSSQITARV